MFFFLMSFKYNLFLHTVYISLTIQRTLKIKSFQYFLTKTMISYSFNKHK